MTGGSFMVRLNFLLAVVLIVSGLYLVKISYESRRLFADIESAHSVERQLESDRRRLEAERQAQATHLRVESTARTKLGMRAATPANTQYVVDAGPGRGADDGAADRRRPRRPAPRDREPRNEQAQQAEQAAPQSSRGRAVSNVTYANSPLLASKTPLWRSRFLVVLVGVGSLVLIGRAAYIQIIATNFYLKQGEARYAHTLEMPASRGRIVDRNGLLLATSVPTPSIWAIPKDVDADAGEKKQLAQALGMTGGRAERPPRRQPELRLAQAPGRRRRGRGRQAARPEGHPPGQRVPPPLSGRRGRGARRGLHRRRGQGPGRHRARVPAAAAGPRRLARGGQGSPGPHRREHRRSAAPDQRRGHRARRSTPRCSSSPTSACATR